MSFIGNFTTNYDKTSQTAGATTNAAPSWHRRPSVSSHHGSEHSTAGNRRPSTGSRHESVRTALHRTVSGRSRAATADEDIPPVPPLPRDKKDESSDSDEAHEVRRLARAYSAVSTRDGTDVSPFEAPEGSSLDPASDNFRARAWSKAMLAVHAGNTKGFKQRSAGIAFRNLSAFGSSAATDYQKTVGNYALDLVGLARRALGHGPNRVDILRNCEGLVRAGEMLVVLGPPGSGCTTFLKTIAGETHGFNLSKETSINYQGISYAQMHKHFRGEVLYTAEQDVHFPMLTVGDTLLFAAYARSPRVIPGGVSRDMYAKHMRDVVMATFGIRHTINTKVGNDFVRGVSGGERKRVSIAEAALSNAPLQCWDNSTRGLDSANAVEFCKTLRNSTELANACAAVAIYQGPETAIQQFDKALVLYEGRQIYFGHVNHAIQFFEDMGFECPERQTTADFLTSMTSPAERVVKTGWERRVPRTPDEFAERWKNSEMCKALLVEIEEYEKEHPIGGEDLQNFKESRRMQQAKQQRVQSPYTLSYMGQVKLCLWRGFRRLAADPSLTITQIIGNSCNALIVGSLFYNQNTTTSSLQSRSALLFFAVLLNAFGSALEILMLYAQRPIVEKHTRYALYHPSAEAFASMLTDIPAKVGQSIGFNLILYFLTNLRREPGAFFFFLMMTFVLTLTMSMMFRTIASVSRSLVQALVPTAIIMISIIIYTGFTIPISYMQGWARWINYLNPTAYGFESLMINEFSGQNFTCAEFMPPAPEFGDGTTNRQICTVVGSIAGQTTVEGERFIESSFQYYAVNKWRNLGILFAFLFGLLFLYLAATEFISEKKSKGEVLLFRRGHKPASLEEKASSDPEVQKNEPGLQLERGLSHREVGAMLQKQTAIFQWRDVCFDIKIKSDVRRILDHVDGWVEPGTMTALMGVSGAGKTTLLDVLATRVTMGVVTGEMLIDGRARDESFQRKTGYVQQQDLHLQTSTVREALNFSALLRQPADTPRQEKLAYVDEVIKLLEMEEFADAIVGVPGEGLNVEQRKRLTIGVELAARPQIMCFLDEPTSGLDSQTSWSILDLMEKLTNNGQAILCTIHQPSAMLFQRFNRLLLLQSGGQTVYFGNIGKNAQILSDYFVRNGAEACPPTANPAEWMLSVIGAAPGSYTDVDWFKTWRESPEYLAVHNQLDTWKRELPETTQAVSNPNDKSDYREFAVPFYAQFFQVQKRIFQQYWRTPSYIYSKLLLCILTGLFIGFSFYRAPNTQQGLQNQLFGIFMLLTLFSQLVQQIMPNFVIARALYESRERPSKTYSWIAFMLSNTLVELPWATLSAVMLFFTWYYPIGLYTDAAYTDAVAERGALVFLLILTFLLFSSTFAHMVIAGIETAETAGNVANLMFSFSLLFNGVLVGPKAMPGFWIFMYRVSPFTYLVEGLLSASVANAPVNCAQNEYLHFSAPAGATCEQYIGKFIAEAGGYLLDPKATECAYCTISETNTYLAAVSISFANVWRDFGLMWVYIIFNIIAAPLIYWLARVPKGGKKRRETEAKAQKAQKAQKTGKESLGDEEKGGKFEAVEDKFEEKAAAQGLAVLEKDVSAETSSGAGTRSHGEKEPIPAPTPTAKEVTSAAVITTAAAGTGAALASKADHRPTTPDARLSRDAATPTPTPGQRSTAARDATTPTPTGNRDAASTPTPAAHSRPLSGMVRTVTPVPEADGGAHTDRDTDVGTETDTDTDAFTDAHTDVSDRSDVESVIGPSVAPMEAGARPDMERMVTAEESMK